MPVLQATVLSIGQEAFSFFDEDALFVLFGENAEPDIARYSVQIHVENFSPPISKGQVLSWADQKFSIIDVGNLVNENLQALGHATLEFGGVQRDLLPGAIRMEGKPKSLVCIGDWITIV